MKRLGDIFLSLIGLVLSIPILIPAGILIKLDSRGPVFFRQKRVGKDGKLFHVWKLRTMVKGANLLGPLVTSRNDPRITQVGALLRALKIDELPQFWNVFKGDMSLVGPRPEVPEIVALYSEEQKKVLSVRPGIFGLNQLIGRDEPDQFPEGVDPQRYYESVLLPEKLKMDLEYVAHVSFWTDLVLIAKGIWATVAGSFKLRYILEGKRRFIFFLVDILLTFSSYYLAFLLRFEGVIPEAEWQLFVRLFPVLLLIRVPLYIYFGLYQSLWQYMGMSEVYGLLKSVGLGSLVFILVSLFLVDYWYPRSVYGIEAMLTLAFLGGFRVGAKLILGHYHQLRNVKTRRNILIVGAGDNGEILARELLRRPELGLWPVGFLDEDLTKRGAKIHGIRVFGDLSMMKRVAIVKQAEEVIVASESLPPEEVQGILSMGREAGLRVRVAPPFHELVSERTMNVKIRDLKIEDLIGRDEVHVDSTGIYERIAGKTVMVTGGGGSIGAELARRIVEFKPKSLVIVERSESDLYEIFFELSQFKSQSNIHPCLTDVTDKEKMEKIFATHRPEIVFHAAAYKHVPLMETYVREAIQNNIQGTLLVADLALRYEASQFVLVSTDKAVGAVSVMGMTKRACELVLQSQNGHGKTRFVSVRFGNVLGSRGSVVPILLRQIELGGPVTVTDARMERYFMGLTEAVMLILQAMLLGEGGEIFVLDMGRPVQITELARLLISYVGFKPDEIAIRYIGLRPGERLEESLLASNEGVEKTRHEKIRRVIPPAINGEAIEIKIGELLRQACQGIDEETLKQELKKVVQAG